MELCPFYVCRERLMHYSTEIGARNSGEPILSIYRGCYHPHSDHRPGVVGSAKKSTCGGDFEKCQIGGGPGVNWTTPAYIPINGVFMSD
jgi:hypothetical protein